MARNPRKAERYLKRLEAEFSAGGKSYKGFLSNVSEAGLFIRTSRSFLEGSEIDIKIYLPNDKTSEVKGIVRRAETTRISKNGMGIELTQRDRNFIDFVSEIGGGGLERPIEEQEPPRPKEEPETPKPETGEAEFLIIACSGCGVKNKVPADKLSLGPRCGGCKEPLRTG